MRVYVRRGHGKEIRNSLVVASSCYVSASPKQAKRYKGWEVCYAGFKSVTGFKLKPGQIVTLKFEVVVPTLAELETLKT